MFGSDFILCPLNKANNLGSSKRRPEDLPPGRCELPLTHFLEEEAEALNVKSKRTPAVVHVCPIWGRIPFKNFKTGCLLVFNSFQTLEALRRSMCFLRRWLLIEEVLASESFGEPHKACGKAGACYVGTCFGSP